MIFHTYKTLEESINYKKISNIRNLFLKILLFSLPLILFFIFIYKIYNSNSRPKKYNNFFQKELVINKIIQNKSLQESINLEEDEYENRPIVKRKQDYENITFKIISKKKCDNCDFFTYYINFIGCIITSISSQRTPIVDLSSYPSIFNEFNSSVANESIEINPWEIYFNHPQNYTLEEVIKNAKILEYEECEDNNMAPDIKIIFSNKYSTEFYHKIIKNFLTIKKDIRKQAYYIVSKLFGSSKNVLGVLIGEEDYYNNNTNINNKKFNVSDSPKYINIKKIINDVKSMDKKNNYDYIYLVIKDEKKRNKFIKEFGEKIKFLPPYEKDEKKSLNMQGIEKQKYHLISIYILSKCIDLVSDLSYGGASALILSEGFRYLLFYH